MKNSQILLIATLMVLFSTSFLKADILRENMNYKFQPHNYNQVNTVLDHFNSMEGVNNVDYDYLSNTVKINYNPQQITPDMVDFNMKYNLYYDGEIIPAKKNTVDKSDMSSLKEIEKQIDEISKEKVNNLIHKSINTNN